MDNLADISVLRYRVILHLVTGIQKEDGRILVRCKGLTQRHDEEFLGDDGSGL